MISIISTRDNLSTFKTLYLFFTFSMIIHKRGYQSKCITIGRLLYMSPLVYSLFTRIFDEISISCEEQNINRYVTIGPDLGMSNQSVP
jgi:hypothetical protein